MQSTSSAPVGVIKVATRQLVAVVGGPAHVTAITGHAAGTISRWQGETWPEIIPLSAVAALELASGHPVMTAALAGLTGYRLVGVAEAPDEADFVGRLVGLAGAAAWVQSAMAAAVADGRVSRREAGALLGSVAKLDAVTGGLRAALSAVLEGGR